MILDFRLLLYLWLKAINIAIKILNRLFTNALVKKVLYILQDKQKRALQIDHLC